jgi:iron complex outermembrane receptor protein
MTYGFKLTHDLSLNGGGSYTRGTLTPQPAININSANLPEIPPLRGWSALRYTRRMMFAELGGLAATRQSKVNSDMKEVPTAGYGVVNFRIGFNFRKFSASFDIDNLLDRYYLEYLSYYRDPFASGVKIPEPGRTLFVQLRYSL